MMGLTHGVAGAKAAARAKAEYLQEKQIAPGALVLSDRYARTEHAAEAIAGGVGCLPIPRPDMAPEVCRALGIEAGKPLTTEQFAHLLAGARADGTPLNGHARGVGTYEAKEGSGAGDRQEVGYRDCIFSAPKSVSVAWALARTDAERASLLRAHQTAVAEAMGYVERQVGWARTGAGGTGPRERARFGWVTCQHYTARPTLMAARVDPATGEAYTEERSLSVTGDPQLHTHVIVPNAVVTESGRVAAMDSRVFHRRTHEFGGVYQAVLARELRAMGAHVVLDDRTNLARLPAVPEWVCEAFSKRNRDAEEAARKQAAVLGLDFDSLGAEQRSGLLAYGARASRRDKDSNRPDFEVWREQAAEMGYEHRGIEAYGPLVPERPDAERMAAADRAGLPHLAEMLSKSAVIERGDVRLAAARGFIAEGIGRDVSADMDRMMRGWADAGVVQDGHWTKLIWRGGDGERTRLTTELHRDQEDELIRLARSGAADRSHALTPEEIAAGVTRSGVSFAPSRLDPGGLHGEMQRAAVDGIGRDGAVSVFIGVAGSGKTKGVLPPLVAAWKARGFDVWGTGQRWSTARDLEESGIDGFRVRALSVLLDGLDRGETKLTRGSVVVLDELGQVGTRELLHLLRHRERIGFKIAAVGDPMQCQAIEAGPVIELLRRALGEDRVPEILTTVRQLSEREREIAGLFRNGKAKEALAAKRADGTAEMVPGGYRDAVRRVADIWAETRAETRHVPGYRITIAAPTNADAREIAREVRLRRREMGEVTGRDHGVPATDGRGDAYSLDIAAGDRMRLYARTRGMVACKDGRRRNVSIGDNGSVLAVLAVLPAEGLRVVTAKGTEAFVPWTALRDRYGSGRLLLGPGDCLTIDSAQGITSDEHVNAVVAGSRGVTAYKAYVNNSRHRVRSRTVLSEGMELREVGERRAYALPPMTREEAREAAWANAARNLSRKPAKESALAFLEGTAEGKREGARLHHDAHRRREARAMAGRPQETVRAKSRERALAAAMPRLAEGVSEAARQRAAVSASLKALRDYTEAKEDRRVEAAARMVSRGDMDFAEASSRLVVMELRDQDHGWQRDPVHHLPIRPLALIQSMEEDHVLETRLMHKLDAALHRLSVLEWRDLEKTPPPTARAATGAKETGGLRA